ncbi:MAG: GNAT family N-acetyltransferase [Opitutaceae bacterium]|nr:GNAT family N-acetyltransferase [Opitutaceae bacterium]
MPANPAIDAKLELASASDASTICTLRMAAAKGLTDQFGIGTWSFVAESEAGVRTDMIAANVFVVRSHGELVATLKLGTRKPWLGEIGFFTPCARPIYLTAMAVAAREQRSGIGRRCLEQARAEAARLNADIIRLDTYDGPAGAADFYRKCGFREVRRAEYNGTPLVWFEAAVTVVASGQPGVPVATTSR